VEDILLIDDDVELCSMLTEYLGKNGYRVKTAHRGDLGLRAAQQRPWAMILLDVMLPGMDGFEVLKRIRAESAVNVLLLTARGEDVDRIVGLEIGADDYLPKPADPRELTARIRAILRRTEKDAPEEPKDDWIRIGEIALSAGRREIRCNDQLVEATAFEFNILEYLLRHLGKIVPREELAEAALGRKLGMLDRSIDVHLSRLRKKLAACGADERIKAVRGSGYIFTGVPGDGENG
jgi:DNA-binding response OmpR family regulator